MFKKLKTGIIPSVFVIFTLFVSNSTISEELDKESIVVFVHGAHLTSKSWENVEAILNKNNVDTYSVDLPGRNDKIPAKKVNLISSSESLCKDLGNVKKPISIVGHSQAGAIINHAISICPSININRIIYLASVSPIQGEKAFDQLSKSDEEHYFSGIQYDKSNSLMVISDQQKFGRSFTSQEDKLDSLSAYAVDEPSKIADNPISYNKKKLDSIKKFYVFTKKDLIISLESQKRIAERIDTVKTSELDTGHIPMITHPNNLASVLLQFMTI